FTDDYDAWFCKFDKDSIKNKIESILELTKDEVTLVGVRGQERLLEVRNYEKIAQRLAETLQLL
ncbi:MAG: glycosyltransferase, partial [Sulfurimonas sp.]